MTKTAIIETPTEAPTIAAVFNLDDPNEARIQKAIQIIYAPESGERLHAMRRGMQRGQPDSLFGRRHHGIRRGCGHRARCGSSRHRRRSRRRIRWSPRRR